MNTLKNKDLITGQQMQKFVTLIFNTPLKCTLTPCQNSERSIQRREIAISQMNTNYTGTICILSQTVSQSALGSTPKQNASVYYGSFAISFVCLFRFFCFAFASDYDSHTLLVPLVILIPSFFAVALTVFSPA